MQLRTQFGRKHAALKVRDFDLQVKAVDDAGKFSGYGSVFGTIDSYREVVEPGAFTESLAELAAKARKVPVLWQHRSGEPIGVYTTLREDTTGLYVEGELLTKDVARAAEAHALMKAGAVTGLSIGYWVRDAVNDEKEGVRRLKKLDLVEVSLVTFPANDDARVEAVKFKLAHGELPTLPEFEKLLREAGFSKSQATAIANRGLGHLLRREADSAASSSEGAIELAAALAGFSLPTL